MHLFSAETRVTSAKCPHYRRDISASKGAARSPVRREKRRARSQSRLVPIRDRHTLATAANSICRETAVSSALFPTAHDSDIVAADRNGRFDLDSGSFEHYDAAIHMHGDLASVTRKRLSAARIYRSRSDGGAGAWIGVVVFRSYPQEGESAVTSRGRAPPPSPPGFDIAHAAYSSSQFGSPSGRRLIPGGSNATDRAAQHPVR